MYFRQWPRFKWERLVILLFVLGLIFIYLILGRLIYAIDKLQRQTNLANQRHSSSVVKTSRKFAVYGKKVDSGYLKHVFESFYALGYVRQNLSGDGTTGDWDVLWSHDYPFTVLRHKLQGLKSGQKINHFPGSGYITNKMNLATSELKYVPKAFQLPKEKENLLNYAAVNPNILFVQKSNNHRGIRIQTLDEMDLTNSESFIQTYISNPLLIDGHKFDIGIYVVLTSIQPLRVYRYNGDVLFRFCPVRYHPFLPEVEDKYVVGDDYLPIWELESLQSTFNEGFSMKETFDSYISSKGNDSARIWLQIDKAIRQIYLTKESLLVDSWTKFGKGRNFFELVRFDFVVDEDLNVFLMEVNMSPNLSSAHFPPNRLLYEQVLFSTLSLVGLANPLLDSAEMRRVVSQKQLYLNASECNSGCSYCEERCRFCPSCVGPVDIEILQHSYLEQLQRMEFIRVFPTTKSHLEEEEILKTLTPQNKWLTNWYAGKCAKDPTWCA